MHPRKGCLFGAAYGDAMGAVTEFIHSAAEIQTRYPGAALLQHMTEHTVVQVTDDTQMMLVVGEALLAAAPTFPRSKLEPALIGAFIAWLQSPDNDRAPGRTCLTACENLMKGNLWLEATVVGSKGCGANMRVQPVGLLQVASRKRAAIAQLQAALTHGHPTALAAADITAYTIALLIEGVHPKGVLNELQSYIALQRHVYHTEWLDDLWTRSAISYQTHSNFIARGWDEVETVLDRIVDALRAPDRDTDPCVQTGDG